MNLIDKDIQLPEAETTDNATAQNRVTADTAEAENSLAATELGKFKSVDALMSAYLNLEAEFTRRSQRLKELEQENKAQNMPETGAPSRGSEIDGEELLKAALASDSVKQAVLGEYLKTLAANKAVPLIVGGVSPAAPKNAPKSVKEAGALAERFLKN